VKALCHNHAAMHRAIIPLICTLGGCLLASCGSGAHVGIHTSPTFKAPAAQRALAFARAVNLTPADVPGFTPSAKHQHDSPREKALERQMLRCAGAPGPAKAIAEEGSKDFELKHAILDFSVSSEVSVQPGTTRAGKGLSAIRGARARGCFSRYLEQSFSTQRIKGAKLGHVSIQSGTPPAPGTSGSFGWRVTARFVLRGVNVPIYLDFLGFTVGPSEVTLLSTGLLRPFPAAVQQQLFTTLLSRAKAHRL
jgi:hypothetical protein